MIILIPLGGIGSRFQKNGYTKPKPLINVLGQPILYYLLNSLTITNNDIVLIPYNNNLYKYNFESTLRKEYPKINFKFLRLNYNTEGAAETILLALNILQIKDQSIICLDGDNFYNINILEKWNNNNCIFVFNDDSNTEAYSYIQINDNKIIDIIEKKKISNYACCGAYGFKSYKELQEYCQNIIDKKIKQKNEYYTSTVIREMLKNNINFNYNVINNDNYICLGTPLQVRLFCNNIPKINALTHKQIIKSKRYCFDLDNTLVSFPKIQGDYLSVEPIQKNINFLRYLKKLGHTIIIYTARRMKTYSGNIGKINANIGKITFDTLEKFNIPYDEIYFGKPYAHYYIDDLGISVFSNLEKELGFYQSYILPRSFNTITMSSIQTFKKQSNDLSGEIYYYNNIPNNVKDMFPVLINYDQNNKWYEMEKINGIPIIKLYLSQELTIKQFQHILNSIDRLHNSNKSDNNNNNNNIYENYINKLKKRYENYDYSKYPKSEEIYNYLLKELYIYEKKNLGQIKVIHGDPVFTNILINNFGKIKFIDMRGKLGNDNSIYGDYLYDYAKIYQSLIGYDEILNNVILNEDYKNKMIKYFEDYFINKYKTLKNLKLITNLLLFTLIPLHNNDKCYKYYDLIKIEY